MNQSPKSLSAESLSKHPVVFFDGVCNLCNGTVDFIIKSDKKGLLRFASLQGETAASAGSLLPIQEEDSKEWSMVFLDTSGAYVRSEGALRLLMNLGGLWSCLGWLGLCFPRFFRDGVYRLIARGRYKWFGKKESCRLPSPEEEERFLP